MKPLIYLSALFLAMVPVVVFSDDFTIEEELTSLPKPIEAAIRSSKGFEDNSWKIILVSSLESPLTF
jgi:hypothetical protein